MKKIFAIATLMCAFALPASAQTIPASDIDIKAGFCFYLADKILSGPVIDERELYAANKARLAVYLSKRINSDHIDSNAIYAQHSYEIFNTLITVSKATLGQIEITDSVKETIEKFKSCKNIYWVP